MGESVSSASSALASAMTMLCKLAIRMHLGKPPDMIILARAVACASRAKRVLDQTDDDEQKQTLTDMHRRFGRGYARICSGYDYFAKSCNMERFIADMRVRR